MADQHKPRFEPPPWEQEAFERFRKAQDEARAHQDLEEALRAVRTPQAQPAVPVAEEPEHSAQEARPEEESRPALSEARINAMLVELRGEETSAAPVSKWLIYGTMAFMITVGTYIIIKSAILFGGVRADGGATTLLAAGLSFVVLLIGLAFLGGAFLLFRKYRENL